jgi:unsaturated rhamnogalacturonyl hydrolase
MENKKTIYFLFYLSFFLTISLFASGKDTSDLVGKNSTNHKNISINSFKHWPELLSDAVIKNYPDLAEYSTKKITWNYELGVVLTSMWKVWLKTKNPKYYNYIKKNIDYFVTDKGNIKTYTLSKYRLDDITSGRVVLDLYKHTGEKKYKLAADLLRKQLREQPRVKEGGFWHKKIYPNQMWLDGLYMAEPFYAEYAQMFNEPKDYNDIAHQFILMYEHARDPKTGLLYHGWDESKVQKWANPKTGDSPSFWGRAIGWYLMGLVDVLDYFPKDHPLRNKLISILQSECNVLWKYRDKKTDLWYLIIDKPGKKGNYLEASASSMFCYVFAKGANKGYLDKKYFDYAVKIFGGIKNNLIKTDKNGLPELINTIRGAGLGGHPYRDGTFKYYAGEPKRTNDFKGLGPLISASLELENSHQNFSSAIGKGKIVGLDYYFNDEWKKKNGKEVKYHYIWEDTANTGYSKLGKVIKNLGAEISEIHTAPLANKLKKSSIYIIVDPDTPQENPHPNYIDETSIKNIVKWVKEGGVLVLFANDKGNCEFKHLNMLAGNFGIHFNDDSRNDVVGKNFAMGQFVNLPDHLVFKGVDKIYLKEISTLKISSPAKAVLKNKGDVIMASSIVGKGFVFAVGDPWLYNEYIDNHKLPVVFENEKAAVNLFEWLLKKAKKVK